MRQTRTRRYRMPDDDTWWEARTIPEHVSPNRIEQHPEHIKEYGDAIRTILPRMVKDIVERFDPISVWLFGSVARGECSIHSDIDLMIIMPEGTDRNATTLDMMGALTRAPLPKDVFVSTPERFERRASDRTTFEHQVQKEGVVLYG